jgi:DNA mismatch endonuclease (patch repair protein)
LPTRSTRSNDRPGGPGARTRPTHVNGLPYPEPTTAQVTMRMQRNPRSGTRPEALVRSELHRRGVRFRKDVPLRLPGRVVHPDIVFTRARLAVFIDGCFWHSCPIHGNQPRTNSDYWRSKLALNVARDQTVDEELVAASWRVLRAWEHEPAASVAERVMVALAEASIAR